MALRGRPSRNPIPRGRDGLQRPRCAARRRIPDAHHTGLQPHRRSGRQRDSQRVQRTGRTDLGLRRRQRRARQQGRRYRHRGEPVTRYFQLKPEYCAGNRFEIAANRLVLHSKPGDIAGVFPEGAKLSVSDARQWQSWKALEAAVSAAPELPVAIGKVPLHMGTPAYLALQRVDSGRNALAPTPADYPERPDARTSAAQKTESTGLLPPYRLNDLPRAFRETEEHFQQLANSIEVDTPDAYINAAVSALGVAADGVWEGPLGVVMHGAVQRKVDEYERLKEFSENIVESINVGILAADLEDRVESWNSQIELLTGIPRERAVGRRLSELFPAALVAEFDRVRGETGIHHIYKSAMTQTWPSSL